MRSRTRPPSPLRARRRSCLVPPPGQGVELGLRSMAAAGADTVSTLLNSPAGRFSFADAAAAAGGAPAAGGQEAQAQPQAQQQAVQQRFEAFLSEVAATGVVPLQMPLFSAHQMGTCRLGEHARLGRCCRWHGYLGGPAPGWPGAAALRSCLHPTSTAPRPLIACAGADPRCSALDPQGQCWEVAGLYAADGSTFPTPTGVNPMIT